MKRNNRIFLTFAASVILVLACNGCQSMKQRIVDEIRIVTVLGLDRGDQGYQGTALFPDFTRKAKVNLLQGSGEDPLLIMESMNRQSPLPIQAGKLKLLVIGEPTAREGIKGIVETVCRDPLISTRMLIAIGSGSARERLSFYLNKEGSELPHFMIEQNIANGNLTPTNMHRFLYDFYGKGRDAIVPYLSETQDGNLEIGGIGIFRKDKLAFLMKGQEMAYFKLLHGIAMNGEFFIQKPVPKKDEVLTLTIAHGSRKIRFRNGPEGREATVAMRLDGRVKGFPSGLGIRMQESYANYRQNIEKEMEGELEKLLYKFQQNGVDPLGIGDMVRARTRGWEEQRFYENDYEKIRFRVKVHMNFNESGIGE
ncbi:Ger(x)C family spore germination protein [Paenibacillus sp. LHD-117]|uniref:Ger(x)C family spore germination protein n=1 Tax=Paenibacillus sp. LHD-117 TaxID=3071412 RepID=UPI0027E01349|nr:Ger(x)C family spore germination protein [Paenibacillus sp. LHD-117]MDQ6421689.1 Ger(x)C family spore germination protein [Paenibacillus sp. LHD-117]